ncbi:hypothetical protein WJX84_006466, partial [Apatococcus fuscideae]
MYSGTIAALLLAVAVSGSLQAQEPSATPVLAQITSVLAKQANGLKAEEYVQTVRQAHGRKLLLVPDQASLIKPEASTSQKAARCSLNIQGNNQTSNGITSASIQCAKADGSNVLILMGDGLLAFKAHFQGVQAARADPDEIDLDPNSLHFVETGTLEIYDSAFDNIAVGRDFSLLTFGEGTSPVLIKNSTFTRITTCVGDHQAFPAEAPSKMCLPVLTVSQPMTQVHIQQSDLTQNSCFDPVLCHS